ncbi:MAG: protein kinase [Acidobacteriota bacterium]
MSSERSRSDSFVGRVLGKYQILDRLGQGGMGTVYRARQTSLERLVAIKVLPAQLGMDDEFVERFRQEARLIAGLQHENIVHIYDIEAAASGTGEPIWYLVMELLDGYDLRHRPGADRPLDPEEIRRIGLALTAALEVAHARGIVHRDIKTANVMRTRGGKIKLMDFGIAKLAGSGVKTATGSVLGTPDYMAPEQAQSGTVTPQTDLYSLGVLLYELATARMPFTATDPFAVAIQHITAEVPPPSRWAPVPPWLEAVILRAMQKDPAHRFASAGEMAAALRIGLPSTGPGHPAVAPVTTPPLPTPADGLPLPTPADARPVPTPTNLPGVTTPYPAMSATPGPATPAGASPPTPPPATVPPLPAAAPPRAPLPSSVTATPGAPRRRLLVPALLAAAFCVLLIAGLWLRHGGDEAAPAPEPAAASPVAETPSATTDQPTDAPDDAAESGLRTALLSEARALLDEGAPDEALAVLDIVLLEAPDDAEALELFDRASQALAAASAARAEEALLADLHSEAATSRGAASDAAGAPRVERSERATRDAGGSNARNAARGETSTRRDASTARETSTASPAVSTRDATTPATATPAATARRSVTDLWRDARRARDDKRYHSLRDLLDAILAASPGDREAREWREDVRDWIEDREDDLRDEVDDLLDGLADAVDDRDRGDLVELWGPRRERAPERFFRNFWSRYPATDARYRIESVNPHDDAADFVAVVILRAKERKGLREKYQTVQEIRWRGRIVDDRDGPHFVSAFP